MSAATTPVPAGVLAGAGLPGREIAAWSALEPSARGSFPADARAASEFLTHGERLLGRLPARPRRTETERAAARAIAAALDDARERFLRAHVESVYGALTADLSRPLRDRELVEEAAERFPGLTPTRAELAAELELELGDKAGAELAQGLFLSHVLSSPRAGSHLIHAMLRPTGEALERLDDFRATGVADLGPAHVTRRGRAGFLELRNPRHLNAEDDTTLAACECGVDLILLDPEIEVGVLRGGPVDHPRHRDARVFGAGLNLTRLYRGRIPFLFFITRDLGYVNKIYRGLSGPEHHPGEPEESTEKLWIAAAETYAIGGACQLLHVVDHVIAARGCRLYLPARREGIIPGASNLRLPRFVGDRLARRAIVSGLEFEAGTAAADPLCDEVVEPEAVDEAIAARVRALTSSGLVNAAANRRALRVGQEPLDLFRRYMATFAKEQAHCHLSPALVRNLEEHWNARERSV
ncbi:MAG: enoyl-CoA hydratase/isomerase family protein [Solirubrobacterales bacterium]|nr:enoyl-CoA hydratase/isomerase family protein [Solirubrobacterales bacterium]